MKIFHFVHVSLGFMMMGQVLTVIPVYLPVKNAKIPPHFVQVINL